MPRGGGHSRCLVGNDVIIAADIHEPEPLKADIALIQAEKADRWGNLTYSKSARNFAPVMAMAADLTVVQARHIVPLEAMDPETIVNPSIFVDRVVHVSNDREWDI